MKKFLALSLALVLALSLIACSSEPDRQPAIDAYNAASDAFNEAAILINDNIELVNEETLGIFTEMSDLLGVYSDLLSSDDEIPQENLDEMTAWLGDALEWCIEAKAEIEAQLAG